MTYLRRSNNVERKGRRTTGMIVLALVVVFGVNFIFPSFYPAALYPIAGVFWKSESSIVGWFGDLGTLVRSKYALVKDNEKLRDDITARDVTALLVASLESENESLKSILGRSGKGNDILGAILSRPPVSPYDTLIVDVGNSEGVTKGNKVYADGDALIGDVIEVYSHESKVSLFSDPGRVTSVLVGTSSVAAEATGKGGGNFTFKMPAEIGVKQGDVVTLPQIRSHIFGLVESITLDSSNSLQTILFRSPVNIQELRFVEIDREIAASKSTKK